MKPGQSTLAIWKPAKRKRWKRMKTYGVVIHTSGRGIIGRAKREHKSIIRAVLDWYRGMERSGVHYTIAHDGTIYQMVRDDIQGAHVGISARERFAYLSGSWKRKLQAKGLQRAVELWLSRWPGYRSPQHLYPARSPNQCYIGVEMVPLPQRRPNGLWFTDAQHGAVRALCDDIGKRHKLPIGWKSSSRLVGHEDIDAFARWDKKGGWDPGAMRSRPRFDWCRII